MINNNIETISNEIKIRDDIEFNKLKNISLRKIINERIIPVISLDLIERLMKYGDSSVKRSFIQELLINSEHIRTINYCEGKSDSLRYYKYLKGMKNFLELDTLVNMSSYSDIGTVATTACNKTTEQRLMNIYGLSIDDIHSNEFTIHGYGDDIKINQRKIEDYIFFRYCWYISKEFQNRKNMYHLEDFDSNFNFSYQPLEFILNRWLIVFELFSDNHNKNIIKNKKNIIQSSHFQTKIYDNYSNESKPNLRISRGKNSYSKGGVK